MAAKRFGLWVVGGWALITWCGVATAQTYYKWTDDQGIVHFADAPPAPGQKVEERHLPVPSDAKATDAQAPAANGDTKQDAQVTPAAGDGPARVVVVSRNLPRTGPSALHIIGSVKNVGAADARRVAVNITAVDSTAGTPCLSEEAAVSPATLRPGESGNFDVDVDSPCLSGDPNVDVAPVWD